MGHQAVEVGVNGLGEFFARHVDAFSGLEFNENLVLHFHVAESEVGLMRGLRFRKQGNEVFLEMDLRGKDAKGNGADGYQKPHEDFVLLEIAV